jgi:hypothetical protein
MLHERGTPRHAGCELSLLLLHLRCQLLRGLLAAGAFAIMKLS